MDEADHASKIQQMEVDAAIERAKNSAKDRLSLKGKCYNCDENIDDYFCDEDCKNDYFKILNNRKRAGKWN